jgi:trk system potassium uptake protein TrkA
VSRVIFPEREMAVRTAHSLVMPNVIDYIELSRDFSIVELPAPDSFVGKSLKQLELRPRFGLMLVAIKRRPSPDAAEVTNIAPAADEMIQRGDVLALLGANERLSQLDTLLERLK